jgi:hypothetical protein
VTLKQLAHTASRFALGAFIIQRQSTELPMDDSWIDELIKWENAHPEYEPFKEDKDSQRQENTKENY